MSALDGTMTLLRLRRWVLCGLVSLAALPCAAQTPDVVRVGAIDFFGVQGTDTAAMTQKLSLHVGQTIPGEEVEAQRNLLLKELKAITGMTPTDVDIVCCDTKRQWTFYVGLPGASWKPLRHAAAPEGSVKLPDEAVALYEKDMAALMDAVQRNAAGEDDSKGYKLAKDPVQRKADLAMRAYALQRGPQIARVLRTANDATQRRVAASLLGYALRSPSQERALAAAADDADSEVRNNAIRALEVLSESRPLQGIDASPFVKMLFSGSWSDRNKSSLLLYRLTASRDPALLAQLRNEGWGPLLDGAGWQSPGHAYAFLMILGRCAGIEEEVLRKMVDEGRRSEIIVAAEKR